MSRRLELIGQRFGSWLVLGLADVKRNGARWSCLCDCGITAIVYGSHMTGGRSTKCKSCGVRASNTGRFLPDMEVTYQTVHARLRNQRGRANVQTCACGKPAEEWAYQHGDPQERTDLRVNRRRQMVPVAFTPNLDAYAPMCIPCHQRLDRPGR